jgi:hypothetical protein
MAAMTSPATMNRSEAEAMGGTSRTTIRMARYVDPHTT